MRLWITRIPARRDSDDDFEVKMGVDESEMRSTPGKYTAKDMGTLGFEDSDVKSLSIVEPCVQSWS